VAVMILKGIDAQGALGSLRRAGLVQGVLSRTGAGEEEVIRVQVGTKWAPIKFMLWLQTYTPLDAVRITNADVEADVKIWDGKAWVKLGDGSPREIVKYLDGLDEDYVHAQTYLCDKRNGASGWFGKYVLEYNVKEG